MVWEKEIRLLSLYFLNADQADKLTLTIRVFNLCLIKKLGLEAWANSKQSPSMNEEGEFVDRCVLTAVRVSVRRFLAIHPG